MTDFEDMQQVAERLILDEMRRGRFYHLTKDAASLTEACLRVFERGRQHAASLKEFGPGIDAGLFGPSTSAELAAKGDTP